MPHSTPQTVVAALYQFSPVGDPGPLRDELADACARCNIKGILLVAPEGINGTIAGRRADIDAILQVIRTVPGFADLDHKESFAPAQPFYRMKVRVKREIVTMGVPDINPSETAGTYVDPEDWNALILDPDVVVIDTRNKYEVRIGTFAGAIDPEIDTFREFPDWLEARAGLANKPKIAMFCTGGIRCEKSTALMKARGFDEVYHLKGGILKYLEQVSEEDSLWRGECFVFDQRVAVSHGLKVGAYELCFGCREPIDASDKQSAKYVPGVSCPHCHDSLSPERRAAFVERQRQIERARKRGQTHFGPQGSKR